MSESDVARIGYDPWMRAMTVVGLLCVAGCGRIGFDARVAADAPVGDGAAPALSPVAHVQSAAAPCCGGGMSESQALASPVTAGDTLVVAIGWFSTSPAVTADLATLTDSLGNAYAPIPSSYALETGVVGYGSGNFYSEIGYATNCVAGADTVRFTLTNSVTFSLIYVVETTPSTLDVATGSAGRSPTPNAGTVTTSTDGDVAIAMTDMDQSDSTSNLLGAGPGWTLESSGAAGTAIFGQEYVAQAKAGALTGDFDGNGAAGQWMASMAAFKSTVRAADAGM